MHRFPAPFILGTFLALLPPPAPAQVDLLAGRTEGTDALITLVWGEDAPAAARLRLESAEGEEVAAVEISPAPGTVTEERLPAALKHLDLFGFSYRAAVEDAAGNPLAGERYLATLDCEGLEACRIGLVAGLSSAGAVTSTAFEAALDELYAGGSENLVGDLLASRPDLAGEALVLGWHQARSLRLASRPGCVCQWLTATDTQESEAATPGTLPQTPGPTRCGGAKLVDGSATCGSGTVITEGSNTMRQSLRCFYRSAPHDRVVGLTTGEQLVLESASVRPCETPCQGRVEHRVDYTGEVAAAADGSGSARATIRARFSTGGSQGTEVRADAEISLDDEGGVDDRFDHRWSVLVAQPAAAELAARAEVELDQPSRVTDPATATAEGRFLWTVNAAADCAAPAMVETELEDLVAGARERTPPNSCPGGGGGTEKLGTRISILVGDCP